MGRGPPAAIVLETADNDDEAQVEEVEPAPAKAAPEDEADWRNADTAAADKDDPNIANWVQVVSGPPASVAATTGESDTGPGGRAPLPCDVATDLSAVIRLSVNIHK